MLHGNGRPDGHHILRCAWIACAVTGAAYACGVCVNCGPSMNGLGWVYVTAWGVAPDHVGQIVRFAPPGMPAWTRWLPRCTWIKRVVGRDEQGCWVYEGDSAERSEDCRDGLSPVPADNVAGVVVGAISPGRMARTLTVRGRLSNHVEFHYPPRRRVACGRGYLVYDGSGLREITVHAQTPVDLWSERAEELARADDARCYELLRLAGRHASELGEPLVSPPVEDAGSRWSVKVHLPRASEVLVLTKVCGAARLTVRSTGVRETRRLGSGGRISIFPIGSGDVEVIARPLGAEGASAAITIDALVSR